MANIETNLLTTTLNCHSDQTGYKKKDTGEC